MRVEESIEIDRSAEGVFDYASNVENFPEWTGPIIEAYKLPTRVSFRKA